MYTIAKFADKGTQFTTDGIKQEYKLTTTNILDIKNRPTIRLKIVERCIQLQYSPIRGRNLQRTKLIETRTKHDKHTRQENRPAFGYKNIALHTIAIFTDKGRKLTTN